MTALAAAGCATAAPALPGVDLEAACRMPPVPTDFSVPESSEFEGGRDATVLSVLVDEEGRVVAAKIETGSGLPAFDKAVLQAARGARFRPGIVDCEPVEQWTTMMFPGEGQGMEPPPSHVNRNETARILGREYPPIPRDRAVGGTTVVLVYVDRNGVVGYARVLAASGHRDLDRAALRVARHARFTPAIHDGEPVAVWTTFPVTFSVR